MNVCSSKERSYAFLIPNFLKSLESKRSFVKIQLLVKPGSRICIVNLKSIVDMIHCLGCLLPEVHEGVLVQDEGVREHVAPKEI
jgi:hypothetical protein